MKLKPIVCFLILGSVNFVQGAPLQYNGSYLGGRLVYDPNTDLTWYQAPYTNTTWYDAMAWAPALGIGGATWRLPSIAPGTVVDTGYSMAFSGNLDDGELGHLWYDDLGNHLNDMTNTGPFDPIAFNPGTNNWCWTSSGPWYGHLATWAVAFDMEHGIYGVPDIDGGQNVFDLIAVCDGNVGAGGLSLTVTRAGNQVVVSWPPTVTGWTLQTNANLAAPTWGNYSGVIVSNSVTNIPSAANVFFRLAR
jgi:hypothetical protein